MELPGHQRPDREGHGEDGERSSDLLPWPRRAPGAGPLSFVLVLRIWALLQTVPEGKMPRAERCWSG